MTAFPRLYRPSILSVLSVSRRVQPSIPAYRSIMSQPPSSPITEALLTKKIKDGLKDVSHVEVNDITGGCGNSFNALIISLDFDGKTQLARNRQVNSLLKDELPRLHAWSPKCYTPEQWSRLSS